MKYSYLFNNYLLSIDEVPKNVVTKEVVRANGKGRVIKYMGHKSRKGHCMEKGGNQPEGNRDQRRGCVWGQ